MSLATWSTALCSNAYIRITIAAMALGATVQTQYPTERGDIRCLGTDSCAEEGGVEITFSTSEHELLHPSTTNTTATRSFDIIAKHDQTLHGST